MALAVVQLVIALLNSGLIDVIVKHVQRWFPDEGHGPVKRATAIDLLMAAYGQVDPDTAQAREAAGLAIDMRVAALKVTEYEDAYGTKFRVTTRGTV